MFEKLTLREKEVAKMIALGMTNTEIIESCGFMPKTYGTHRAAIMRKTGARNNVELTRLAIAHALVPVPTP